MNVRAGIPLARSLPIFKIYRAWVGATADRPPASGWGYHLPLHGRQGFPRLSPEPSEPYNIRISAKNLQDFQIPLDPTALFREIFSEIQCTVFRGFPGSLQNRTIFA